MINWLQTIGVPFVQMLVCWSGPVFDADGPPRWRASAHAETVTSEGWKPVHAEVTEVDHMGDSGWQSVVVVLHESDETFVGPPEPAPPGFYKHYQQSVLLGQKPATGVRLMIQVPLRPLCAGLGDDDGVTDLRDFAEWSNGLQP